MRVKSKIVPTPGTLVQLLKNKIQKEGISALKLSPKIAKNIKNILGKEEEVKLSPLQKSKKTYRIRTELPLDTDIAAVEKQYSHLNFKLNPKPTSKGTLKGVFDAPIEHLHPNPVKNKSYPVKLTDDPKIRSQYPVSVISQKFALENIDDPFFKRLGEQYGNQTYMGEKFQRLNKNLLTRLANINRKKVGKELGVDSPLRGGLEGKDSGILTALRRTNPDIELLPPAKRYLTRGAIKRNKTLNDYLRELDPKTGMPRKHTMTNQELIHDPRFKGFYGGEQTGKAGLKALEDRIQEFRKKHDLEVVINKFGREKGTGGEYFNINPKKGTRLYEIKRLFKAGKFEQSDEYAKRTLDTAKRSEIVMNAVLDKLSPGQREIALGWLDKGKPFMQALHAAAARDKNTPKKLWTAQAISTWYRNIMHRESEGAIKQLLKEKARKGKNRSDFEIDLELAGWEDDMRALGLKSEIDGKIYGDWYDQTKGMIKPLVEDLEKEYPLKMMNFLGERYKPKGAKEGGLINDPLTAMMSSGGFMDYGEMKPVVPPLDPGERQHLVKGGRGKGPIPTPGTAVQYIKKQVLPKVIGHTTKIMEKLTAPKDAPKVVSNPWAVVDRDGLPIKDFKTERDAEKWLYNKKETVPENEYYTSTIDYSVKPIDQIKTATVMEETPAMMWKAPEIIKNAPMETAQGKQWYGILKKAGVSPKELDDTSLGPFLDIQQPNTKFTKAELLEQFDSLAPKIEVLTTGKREQGKYLQNILTKFNSVRDSISDFSGKDQGVLNSFTGILEKAAGAKTDTQLNVLANQTNKLMKQAYGVDNALMSDQIPAIRQIPAPIRSIFGDMQELFKTRGAAHAFDKKPSHAGDQVLPGGVNYREYMFKYTPNQLRFTEPTYTPGHKFDFSDEVAKNTFVHARISDRTDNFGRKLLFVEEIQSDMHQRPQKAIRQGKPSGYATRKDKILSAQTYIDEMAVLQNKIDAILAREPNHASLPKLYKQRGTLAAKIEKIRGAVSGGGDIPEGPFQRSEDYGSFVVKYLLRLAKEGNYDGVAVSTGNIKNRRGYGSQDEQKGHYGFYDKIMQKVMKKIAKNADLEYNRTVINDGKINWGNIPILILKEMDKVMKGLPSFREGGLNRENFVDVVPLL